MSSVLVISATLGLPLRIIIVYDVFEGEKTGGFGIIVEENFQSGCCPRKGCFVQNLLEWKKDLIYLSL